MTTHLKILLQARHLQAHGPFSREYDKVAKGLDPSLVGHWPSRATLHRWMTGTVKRLPYPDHCRILEAMFPGWTSEQLLQPTDTTQAINEVSDHYGAARMTVETAMRLLREEGLIVSLSPQGSGISVGERTERPIGLRPHIDRAFEQELVSLDFAGLSGQTLQGVVQEPLDKIRAGHLRPTSIRLRALVPDASVPWSLPTGTVDLQDDPAFRERAHRIMRRHMSAIVDSVHELSELGLINESRAEVRVHRAAPLFKLYIINEAEVFFGFYPVREHKVRINDEPHAVYDLMGKDAVLFHHAVNLDESSTGTQYVEQARLWFDSMWDTIARPIEL